MPPIIATIILSGLCLQACGQYDSQALGWLYYFMNKEDMIDGQTILKESRKPKVDVDSKR